MTSVPSKLYTDDVSLLMVLLDTNPFFWSAATATSLSFSKFLSHVLAFLNSVLLLNQLNQVVVIATGFNTCDYVFDSSVGSTQRAESLLQKLEAFVVKDEQLGKEVSVDGIGSSLLSGSLSMALCYIQRIFRSGPLHPQPRILCLHGSPDGPEQYVAIMNAIFSAQRSMVPIDSCLLGAQHSAFLQQASYITGGVYLKPQQLDGLFQYLSTVFGADLLSRSFLQLPKPVGVDFRASCFCHKNTIDMGYICSVCLSIFCQHHKKCSTCGSVFGQAQTNAPSTSSQKRKTPET
ncbi:general transcription and DNA repair factor IIH subunit TFB4 [Actinidia eriantha]|uniref:general transcription and DNA repair factor IIH subunit TFB4 n=1 Tax=Actinidia eriantha TaxID=165200 RepID=UPI00258E8B08|nr:general transcription and DNA repair factor IIH subunit TFB4 [Actinidia eriantha]